MESRQSRRFSAVSAVSEVESDTIFDISQPSQTHSSIEGESISTSPCLPEIPAVTQPQTQQGHVEASPLLLNDIHDSTEIEDHPAVKAENISDSPRKCDWLPLTLRLPYLIFLFTLSLFLSIIVLVLTIYSAKNYGLGNDDESSSVLFFGWRFSPTLVATIYALLVASMLNDVRRTEIFARLSRPGGAPAKDTLCFPARSWWSDPCDALSKTKRSWALFFASLLYMLVILVISPLSAGFLSPADVQVPTPVNFDRAVVANDFSWEVDVEDLIMFRTISGAILNQSTSAWLSKHFAVLPFWPPASAVNLPLRSRITTELHPTQWKAQTVAYNMELECTQMKLTNPYNASYGYYDTLTTFFVLTSEDGCTITLTTGTDDSTWLLSGGGLWSDQANNYTSLDSTEMTNGTKECGDRTMLFVNNGTEWSQLPHFVAHLCSEKFYSANISATASINQTSTVVDFDEEGYLRKRVPLDSKIFNITQLRASFLSPNWTKHFQPFDSTNVVFAGPLSGIAANTEYNNIPEKLIAGSNLKQQASELYQQFFGEMLFQALESKPQIGTSSGHIVASKRRILVSMGIGITLASLLVVSACYVAIVAYTTRLSRRALNLVQDPGTIAAAASLVVFHSEGRLDFKGTDCFSQKALTTRLKKRAFRVTHGDLIRHSSRGNDYQRGTNQCHFLLLVSFLNERP